VVFSVVDILAIDKKNAKALNTSGLLDNPLCNLPVDHVVIRVKDESKFVYTGEVAAIHLETVEDVPLGELVKDEFATAGFGDPRASWVVEAGSALWAATPVELDLQGVKVGHLAKDKWKSFSIAVVMSGIDEGPDHTKQPSL
jgi:hypothetical protein